MFSYHQSAPSAIPSNIVVSVDFGTSHSGYAFALPGLTAELAKPDNASRIASFIFVRNNWPGERLRYPKTLSATLYDRDGNTVAHGHQALDKYLNLRGKEIQDHLLVRRVKLMLADDINYRDPELERRTLCPEEIIGDFLGHFLKVDILQKLESAGFRNHRECSITWVITIPTSWSVSAKSIMESAAKHHGLLDRNGKVVFCLEPEAAVLSIALGEQ